MPPSLPDAVVFDNDGLLLDTESVWTRAEQHLFELRGTEFTPADKLELVGTSAEIAGGILERRLGEPGRAAELIEELNELVVAELSTGWRRCSAPASCSSACAARGRRSASSPTRRCASSAARSSSPASRTLRRRPQRPRGGGAEAGAGPLPGGLPAARGGAGPGGGRAGGLADRGRGRASGGADRDRHPLGGGCCWRRLTTWPSRARRRGRAALGSSRRVRRGARHSRRSKVRRTRWRRSTRSQMGQRSLADLDPWLLRPASLPLPQRRHVLLVLGVVDRAVSSTSSASRPTRSCSAASRSRPASRSARARRSRVSQASSFSRPRRTAATRSWGRSSSSRRRRREAARGARSTCRAVGEAAVGGLLAAAVADQHALGPLGRELGGRRGRRRLPLGRGGLG